MALLEMLRMLGVNLLSWFTIPKNLRSSVGDVGFSILRIALVLRGSGEIPFASIMCPRKLSRHLLNSHFCLSRVTP